LAVEVTSESMFEGFMNYSAGCSQTFLLYLKSFFDKYLFHGIFYFIIFQIAFLNPVHNLQGLRKFLLLFPVEDST